jgi:hypothetical protein
MLRKVGLAGVLLAMPLAAQAMTVADFLAKANALKAQGMMAMMSPDISVLRSEMQAATTSYRADVDAARAKGVTMLGCPPPKGKANVTSDMVIADFAALPKAAQQRMTVKAGLYAFMTKRFPCR